MAPTVDPIGRLPDAAPAGARLYSFQSTDTIGPRVSGDARVEPPYRMVRTSSVLVVDSPFPAGTCDEACEGSCCDEATGVSGFVLI